MFLNKNGFERVNVPVTHNLNQYSKIVELYPDVVNQVDRMIDEIFKLIYDMRFYDPLYFQLKHHEGDGSVTQRNYYNHLQPLLSILATLDNNKFKPGAKRYFKMIARGSDIKFLEKSTSPIKLLSKTNVKVETPKTAVCVSGMMRSDFEFYLSGLKENVIDPLNADVYMG
jgi:hypothetical protein